MTESNGLISDENWKNGRGPVIKTAENFKICGTYGCSMWSLPVIPLDHNAISKQTWWCPPFLLASGSMADEEDGTIDADAQYLAESEMTDAQSIVDENEAALDDDVEAGLIDEPVGPPHYQLSLDVLHH